MSTSLKSWTRLLALLLATCHLCELCFVENCPPGGKKRSYRFVDQLDACQPSCASGRGVCLGRNLCCGNFGCIVGQAAGESCDGALVLGSVSGVACRRRLPRCQLQGSGRCSAPGVCCDFDACRESAECRDFHWSE